MRGRAARPILQMMDDLLGRVRALAAAAQGEEFFVLRTVAGDLRIEARIGISADVNGRAHLGERLAKYLVRTFLDVRLPNGFPLFVSRSFDRAIENDPMIGRGRVTPHLQSGGTNGDALIVDAFSRARRFGMLSGAGIDGDDGVDLFGVEEFINAKGIMTRVVDGGVDRDRQFVLVAAFEETIEAFEGEREIALGGRSEREVNGQVVTAERDDVLIESVAEVVDLAIGIEAPVGGGISVEARAATFVVAIFAALAGRFAGGAGAGGESGTVATEVEMFDLAEHSARCGWNDGDGEEGIFQALEKILGSRL